MDKAITNFDQLLKKDSLSVAEIAITLNELQKLLKEEAAAPTSSNKTENASTEKLKYRIKFLCGAITEIEDTKNARITELEKENEKLKYRITHLKKSIVSA